MFALGGWCSRHDGGRDAELGGFCHGDRTVPVDHTLKAGVAIGVATGDGAINGQIGRGLDQDLERERIGLVANGTTTLIRGGLGLIVDGIELAVEGGRLTVLVLRDKGQEDGTIRWDGAGDWGCGLGHGWGSYGLRVGLGVGWGFCGRGRDSGMSDIKLRGWQGGFTQAGEDDGEGGFQAADGSFQAGEGGLDVGEGAGLAAAQEIEGFLDAADDALGVVGFGRIGVR